MVKVIIFLFLCLPNLALRCGPAAHDSIKILLLQTYVVKNTYDRICLSETFLISLIQTNDDRISIDGYNLIRADHPSNSKRRGVCVYYEEHIPMIKRDKICTLHNFVMKEIRSEGKIFSNLCLSFPN